MLLRKVFLKSQAHTIVSVAIVACLGACSESSTSPVQPDPLALHGRIVFESNPTPGPSAEIVSTAMDGSDLKRISDPSISAICPSLSPDGRWIAYYRRELEGPNIRTHFVELMRSDGTHRQTLLEIPGGPYVCAVWSRDSNQFVVVVYRTGVGSSLIAHVFAVNGTKLHSFDIDNPANLSYSPDGTHFVMSKLEIISVIDVDGLHEKVLSQGRGGQWSAERNQIYFQCIGGGICAINPDGSGQKTLVGIPSLPPSLSPDGTRMAFLCRSDLCVANLDGVANSTDQVSYPGNPVWSADSQTIAIVMGGDIYTFDRDLQNRRRITNTVPAEKNPSISPP